MRIQYLLLFFYLNVNHFTKLDQGNFCILNNQAEIHLQIIHDFPGKFTEI